MASRWTMKSQQEVPNFQFLYFQMNVFQMDPAFIARVTEENN